ncbi:MAG: hypothetical protein R3279_05380 [Putridiphycobacter sp.]|nr:hypothetical protein [Putridiphycobacter sp.]
MILIAKPSIVYGQYSTPNDSTVEYTIKQDINCLRCLALEQRKNIEIANKSAQIENLNNQILLYDSLSCHWEESYFFTYEQNEKLHKKIANKSARLPFWIGVSGYVGYKVGKWIETLFI